LTGLFLLPSIGHTQTLQYPGFYISAEGGVNWMFNTIINNPNLGGVDNLYPSTGWLVGGSIGYDFLGPRLEVEGVYRNNNGTRQFTQGPNQGVTLGFVNQQTAIMANAYYDFWAGSMIVPYVGAGLGVAFNNYASGGGGSNSTNFAYQGMIGVGWNVQPQIRLNLEGRYYGTTSPSSATPGNTFSNNNMAVVASVAFRFGAPSEAPPPPPIVEPITSSFMVFFDWDRSNLSQQALATIQQAADAFKAKGNARITATGHTDTSGPEAYNVALSLRRANAVKDALVRDGVPAAAITVIGMGEKGLLVPTGDGVREPQNRRVEIVFQ
jgi:outer membrane protein OmpA-like peptidoglycan-associated protein